MTGGRRRGGWGDRRTIAERMGWPADTTAGRTLATGVVAVDAALLAPGDNVVVRRYIAHMA